MNKKIEIKDGIIVVNSEGDIIFNDTELQSLEIVILNFIIDYILENESKNDMNRIPIETSKLSVKMGTSENYILNSCINIYNASIITELDGKFRILTGYEFNPRDYNITLYINKKAKPYLTRYRVLNGMFRKRV